MRKNLVERVFNRFLKSDWGEKGIITSINVHELNKAWGCRTFLSVLWQVLWHEAWVGVDGLSPGSGTWLCISCDWGLTAFVKSVFTDPARLPRALIHGDSSSEAYTISPLSEKKRLLPWWWTCTGLLSVFYVHKRSHVIQQSCEKKKVFFFTNGTERRVNRDENRHRKCTTWAFTTGQQDRGRGAGGQQTLQMNRPK